MKLPKSNAREFKPDLKSITKKPSITEKLFGNIRRFKRHILRMEVDDADWSTYSTSYGPQNEAESFYFTFDLGCIDHKVIDGRIYILGDCKPLQGSNRSIIESVINLPNICSVSEIGTGNGKIIVNIKRLLGANITYSASDISEGQLCLFKQRFPDDYAGLRPYILDITKDALAADEKSDVVFAATVLMHIKRSAAYRNALKNLLLSANRYVTLIDYWRSHDYYSELQDLFKSFSEFSDACIYKYDSGTDICIIVGLNGNRLMWPYEPVKSGDELMKYL